jgi:carbonic anhydrase
VPIEFVFDQGLGELFVIRLAGNVIDPDVQGSVEYAAMHLGTRLVVVMGHESCGAVTAALMSPEDRAKEAEGVRMLLTSIDPALEQLDPKLEGAERLHAGVEANVRNSIQRLLEFPGHRALVESGEVTIIGAVYELETGRIRWLED